MPEIDERDVTIIQACEFKFNEDKGLRQGDYVIFADDVVRRISYIWPESAGVPKGIQTSDINSSYYLGDGYVSMGNGSLYPPVSSKTLTLTDQTRYGPVWIFHHGYRAAHNGVSSIIRFRVYSCSEDASKY